MELEPTQTDKRREPISATPERLVFESPAELVYAIKIQTYVSELKRAETPRELPRINETNVARPRRSLSVAVAPAAGVPPLDATAGLSETTVVFTSNPPPKYPAVAVAARVEGTVLVKLSISDEGHVQSVEIVHSSGHAILDEAAMNAVMHWTGLPATGLRFRLRYVIAIEQRIDREPEMNLKMH